MSLTGSSKVSEISDLQLAVAVLQRDGSSREEALAAVVADPGVTDRLAPRLEAMRAEIQATFDRAAEEALAATPEGRSKAALAALEMREKRAKLLAGARAMLEEDGLPCDGLEDREILHLAGIEKQPDLLSQQERDAAVEKFAIVEYPKLNATERSMRASELGTEVRTAERYREMSGLSIDSGAADGGDPS